MNRDFLKELLNTPSVSGHEEHIQEKALGFGRGFAQTQLTDPSGNAVSVVNPEAEHKILLCGHIDEIGFLVTYIDDSGRLRLMKNGGVSPKLYIGSPVQVIHDGRRVHGVVATYSDLLEKDKVKDTDLLVDIGASSKEEAEKLVSVGDPVCADTEVRELMNGLFTCRALDDKTGAFVVLEAAKLAAEKGAKMGIYAATTVGEETSGLPCRRALKARLLYRRGRDLGQRRPRRRPRGHRRGEAVRWAGALPGHGGEQEDERPFRGDGQGAGNKAPVRGGRRTYRHRRRHGEPHP